jgi:plasmid stabilization system protein ParE
VHERQHGLHRAFSKRFPFAIFYEVTGTTIEIFAVLDCRQDPESIESRLRGYE